MKLIDEERVKVASENYSVNRSSETGQIDFMAGVDFAESKLQNLAIEFWEYGMKILMDVDRVRLIPPRTTDLFNQFLKERDNK